jgi:HEAT repeat protein
MTKRTHIVTLGAGICVLVLSMLQAGCGIIDVEPGSEGLLKGALTGRRGPRPLEAAEMAIDPYNANNRYLGTLALANAYFAGQEPYVALFVDNIDDPESSVRAAAARGLANHGEASHAPLLLGLLSDEDPRTRQEATRGLQRLHNPQADVLGGQAAHLEHLVGRLGALGDAADVHLLEREAVARLGEASAMAEPMPPP